MYRSHTNTVSITPRKFVLISAGNFNLSLSIYVKFVSVVSCLVLLSAVMLGFSGGKVVVNKDELFCTPVDELLVVKLTKDELIILASLIWL